MTSSIDITSLGNKPDLTQQQSNSDRSEVHTTSDNPQKTDKTEKKHKQAARLEPTRYGDWEKNGRCIDF